MSFHKYQCSQMSRTVNVKPLKVIKCSAVLSRSVDLNIIIFVNFGIPFACISGLNEVFPVLRVS